MSESWCPVWISLWVRYVQLWSQGYKLDCSPPGIYFSYLRAVVTSPVSQVSVFSSLSACLVSSISATAGQMLMRRCEVHLDIVCMLVGGIPRVETSEVAANQSSSEVVDST